MLVSIVTPSFRANNWLPLCIASVADQRSGDLQVEHIIQDASSDDGTLDWLLKDRRFSAYVEKDEGMYDGVNRGLQKASGEIVAYLNCDEQYLPGALTKVAQFFSAHPETDILFGDAILVDADLRPLSCRRAILPTHWHTLVRPLCTLTCATFFRRRLLNDGMFFDPNWKIIGDKDWVIRAIQKNYSMAVLHEPLAIFTFTGSNLSESSAAQDERSRWRGRIPRHILATEPLQRGLFYVRKWLAGAYLPFVGTLAYYTRENSHTRKVFEKVNVPTNWRNSS